MGLSRRSRSHILTIIPLSAWERRLCILVMREHIPATLGHDIMVEASDGSVEYGKQTTSGSTIWFMTESKDCHVVSEYCLILGKLEDNIMHK